MKRRVFLACATACGLLISTLVPATADGLAGAYLAGRQASSTNDYSKATEYYVRALALDSSNELLLENTVLSFIGNGQVDRSVPIAKRLLELNPKSQIANMVTLVADIHDGKFDAVKERLEGAETVGPLVDGLVLAWAELGSGNMTKALEQFDAEGLDTFGVYHKGLALAMVGDMEAADQLLSGRTGVKLPATRRGVIAHLQVLSQLEKNDMAVAVLDQVFGTNLDSGLAAIRQKLGGGETLPFDTIATTEDGVAEVFFSVAGALSGEANDGLTLLYTRIAEYLRPGHVDSILLTAQLLEQLERYELATKAYDRIPRDDPSFSASELGRAAALRLAGNNEAAIEVLNQLSETQADQPDVHVTLGDLLRSLDRYEESSAAYDRAIALYDTEESAQWVVYFARGITHERTDNWEAAEADFRFALKLWPDQPQVLNYLGYSFVEMKENMDEALAMIETAVAARPNDGYITDSLGWVLYRFGRYEEAVSHMERATELMPVDPIINDHLGDVYWAVGRTREAEFQWYRALSFKPEDVDADRIRRKLEVGLDVVLEEEGGDPIKVSNDG